MKNNGRKRIGRPTGSNRIRHRIRKSHQVRISDYFGSDQEKNNQNILPNCEYVISDNSNIGDVFTGPSVDGADKEYVKVYSGKVIDKKPSFV